MYEAKARFSELIRRVRSDGPQSVTVHGRDEVVVLTAEEYRRLKGGLTGAALIKAIKSSPYRDLELAGAPTYALYVSSASFAEIRLHSEIRKQLTEFRPDLRNRRRGRV